MKRDSSERRCRRGCVSYRESRQGCTRCCFLWSHNLFFVVSSCERFMIVTFESQNVTNVQQRVTVSVRHRNEWRSVSHICFRGCVYHYSKFCAQEEWCFVSTRASRRLRNRTIVSDLLQHIYLHGEAPDMGQCMSESTTPDVGKLLDRLVGNTEMEEATKAKLT